MKDFNTSDNSENFSSEWFPPSDCLPLSTSWLMRARFVCMRLAFQTISLKGHHDVPPASPRLLVPQAVAGRVPLLLDVAREAPMLINRVLVVQRQLLHVGHDLAVDVCPTYALTTAAVVDEPLDNGLPAGEEEGVLAGVHADEVNDMLHAHLPVLVPRLVEHVAIEAVEPLVIDPKFRAISEPRYARALPVGLRHSESIINKIGIAVDAPAQFAGSPVALDDHSGGAADLACSVAGVLDCGSNGDLAQSLLLALHLYCGGGMCMEAASHQTKQQRM